MLPTVLPYKHIGLSGPPGCHSSQRWNKIHFVLKVLPALPCPQVGHTTAVRGIALALDGNPARTCKTPFLSHPRLCPALPCSQVGHTAAVRGIAFAPDGETCVSCGTDATVKLWRVPYAPFEAGGVQQDAEPVFEFQVRARACMHVCVYICMCVCVCVLCVCVCL